MVSKDKEFEYVTSQIIKHVERSEVAFRLFVQLFAAVVGGCIWLSIQPNTSPKYFVAISNILIGLITLISGVMVIGDYRAWYGFRIAQSKLVPHVPEPRWPAFVTAGAMVACMILACLLFWTFNPLGADRPAPFLPST